mmetsp:Transcript_8616/g.22895  ORF Transcript_8616/g.22895 Transcript_8616/m.22895 type:complete len:454 (-) Transcript_8616:543-1904(-)
MMRRLRPVRREGDGVSLADSMDWPLQPPDPSLARGGLRLPLAPPACGAPSRRSCRLPAGPPALPSFGGRPLPPVSPSDDDGFGERPRDAARMPEPARWTSGPSTAVAPSVRSALGASWRAASSSFRCSISTSRMQKLTVSEENWLQVASTWISCGLSDSASWDTGAPCTAALPPLVRSRCEPTALSISDTTSLCAQSRSPCSLSRVRSNTTERMGISLRLMDVMTIFVTASQPTFGCCANSLTSLSPATPTFTSMTPDIELRSIKVGNTFPSPMLMSSPDSDGASFDTAVWQSSTAHRKTDRSAPTGLPSTCSSAMQMLVKASSGPLPLRAAACAWPAMAFPISRIAAMTAFSSPRAGKASGASASAPQPTQAQNAAGTCHARARPPWPLDASGTAEGTDRASSSSGSFRNLFICASVLPFTSLGSAATQAARAGICAASSPRHLRCSLQISA